MMLTLILRTLNQTLTPKHNTNQPNRNDPNPKPNPNPNANPYPDP